MTIVEAADAWTEAFDKPVKKENAWVAPVVEVVPLQVDMYPELSARLAVEPEGLLSLSAMHRRLEAAHRAVLLEFRGERA